MGYLNPFDAHNSYQEEFNAGLARFQENPGEVMAEVENFRSQVLERLVKLKDEYEEGIRGTPNVQMNFYKTGLVDDSASGLLSHAIGWYCVAYDKPHLVEELKNLAGPGRSVSSPAFKVVAENTARIYSKGEPAFKVPGGQADYRLVSMPIAVIGDQVKIFQLPSVFFEDIEVPNILKPFVLERVAYPEGHDRNSFEYLEEVIVHEFTHIYIVKHVSMPLEIATMSSRNEINEGAAQAVSSVLVPSNHISAEYYRQEGTDTNYLQFFKLLFLIYAERFDSEEEKVYGIRQRAVQAYMRYAKGMVVNNLPGKFHDLGIVDRISLVDMVLDDADEDRLMAVARAMWFLEQAEELTLHPLAMLNIIPAEEAKNYAHKIESDLNSVYSDSLEQLFPDESYISDGSGVDLIDTIAQKTSSSLPGVGEIEYEKTEIRESLRIIENGLQDVERVRKNESPSREEERALVEFESDLKEAIKLYKEERKIERRKGQELAEKHGGRAENVVKWYKQTYYHKDFVDPIRVAGNLVDNMDALLEKYRTVITTGDEYNRKLLQALEKLHGDEERVEKVLRRHSDREKYQHLERFIELTEEVYEIVEDADGQFRQAIEYLDSCEEELSELS